MVSCDGVRDAFLWRKSKFDLFWGVIKGFFSLTGKSLRGSRAHRLCLIDRFKMGTHERGGHQLSSEYDKWTS